MQYRVYLTTHLLEMPEPQVSKYFEQTQDAEDYYEKVITAGKFNHRPFILILEKMENKNILNRHDFARKSLSV